MTAKLCFILLALGSCLAIPSTLSAQSAPPGPAGTWAQLISTTAISSLPIVGDLSTRTQMYSLVEIKQDGDALQMQTNVCWVRMDGDIKKVRAIVPDAMLSVIGPKIRDGRMLGGATNRNLRFAKTVDVLGANLANPGKDPLPTELGARTIIDEDGDGHPGVTIRMVGLIDGEMRVVQRTWNELTGSLSADGDSIAGLVTWRSEQNVLDATSRFLRTNPESKPHPDAAKSFFRMRRVSEGTGCQDIVRAHARLFPE